MSLTLTRSALSSLDNIPGQHTWPLQVTCVSSTQGLPSEIFVYHFGGSDHMIGDVFECVASVHQLDEIGLTPVEVDDQITVPYYRTDELVFNCRSPEEAEDLWIKVQGDALDLMNNFNARAALTAAETIVLS